MAAESGSPVVRVIAPARPASGPSLYSRPRSSPHLFVGPTGTDTPPPAGRTGGGAPCPLGLPTCRESTGLASPQPLMRRVTPERAAHLRRSALPSATTPLTRSCTRLGRRSSLHRDAVSYLESLS